MLVTIVQTYLETTNAEEDDEDGGGGRKKNWTWSLVRRRGGRLRCAGEWSLMII